VVVLAAVVWVGVDALRARGELEAAATQVKVLQGQVVNTDWVIVGTDHDTSAFAGRRVMPVRRFPAVLGARGRTPFAERSAALRLST